MTYEEYEKNLKDYLDIIKDDLKTILTSTIPTQKNLMKTILWINMTLIGAVIALFKFKAFILLLSIPFVFSSIAVILILKSLTDGRIKSFASPPLDSITKHLKKDYERHKGLMSLISSVQGAFENNAKIVQKRAEKIHTAINFTVASAISVFFIIILIANKAIFH